MNKTIVLLLSLFFTLSCSTPLKKSSNPQVKEFKHLGFSADQSQADFDSYTQQGYKRVVNLRQVGEEGFSPRQAKDQQDRARAAGLVYLNAPFLKEDVAKKSLTHQKMETIEKAVMGDGSREKTLITCSSGARATAWLAWHMHQKHGMEFQKAKEIAFKLGPQDENAQKALEAVEALLQE
jgi:uncharacterized protein (TIGR01244 family)